MKSTRILNGYVVVYLPDHPKAMTSNNWKGYVYEHIVIAEEDYGREIIEGEEVHHLDLDRGNNSPNNLVILSKKSHGKIHKWIDKGAPISKDIERIPINSMKPKLRCKVCSKPLKLKQTAYCSVPCRQFDKSSIMDEHDLDEILFKLSKSSVVQVAKHYSISDNGLTKWLHRRHGLNKAILSEALSTLRERAETTGEVKSS